MYSSTPVTKTLLLSICMLTLGIGSIWVLAPFLPSLLWATMITIATWPLLNKLENKMGGKRGFAITIMLLAMGALVILPIGVAASMIFSHVDDAIAWLRELPQKQLPPLPEAIANMPMLGPKISVKWQEITAMTPDSLTSYIHDYSLVAMNWLAAAAKSAGVFFLHLLLTFGLTGLLYAQGDTAAAGIRKFFIRIAGERGDHGVILAAQSIKAVAMGIVVTALIQTAMAGAGFFLAQVPFAGILTAVAFVLCIAQLGVIVPMLLAVGWLYFKNENVVATLLLVWSVITAALDNVIRPMLIKKGADLPMILILAGVLGGLYAFGVVGLFIGPALLAVTYRLLESWVSETRIELQDVAEIKPLPKPIRPKESSLDH
jgi:predicted PurR-regulated permease PerM